MINKSYLEFYNQKRESIMVKQTLSKIHSKIEDNKVKIKIIKKLKKQADVRFVLLGSPLHGNLGDQAIVISIIKYLQDKFPLTPIIEIPSYYFNIFTKDFRKYINYKDIILIPGGGFLGTVWLNEEKFVRNVIKIFNKNKIIIFPQSVIYENNEKGNKELINSKNIYSEHKNLTIIAREKISYNFLKSNFNNNILLTPDIVLYMYNKYYTHNTHSRTNNVVFCFRKDKEKLISDDKIKYIEKVISKNNLNIIHTDTVVNHNIFPNTREQEVLKILDLFSNSKLVITDRLHGMIFSIITHTPCIVLNNNNHKIIGVYDWIKSLKSIRMLEEENEITELINELLDNNFENNFIEIDKYFLPLKECLNNCLKNNNQI